MRKTQLLTPKYQQAMVTKVKLRQKAILNGRRSLYLDFYPAIYDADRGIETRRLFLGLYILAKPLTLEEKKQNRDTIQMAEQIRNLKENELNKQEVYSVYERERLRQRQRSEHDFLEYFLELANQRNGTNHTTWLSCYKHLQAYTKGQKVRFCDIDPPFIEGFKRYFNEANSLRHFRTVSRISISDNTRASYCFKLKAALRKAHRDGFMEKDLSFHMGKITLGDVKRQFLTIDELNRLAKTDCNFMMLKEAALFSALTGLRYSDIEKLTWGEIEYLDGMGNVLSFRQQKTLKVENLPISDQAMQILGPRGKPDQRVFPTLKYSCQISKALRDWAEAAGVKKKLTFHCFRHTFATLQFSQGTDIYTVSKLLGHRELKTTQVYVKVMDATKRTAVDKLKIDMPLPDLPVKQSKARAH